MLIKKLNKDGYVQAPRHALGEVGLLRFFRRYEDNVDKAYGKVVEMINKRRELEMREVQHEIVANNMTMFDVPGYKELREKVNFDLYMGSCWRMPKSGNLVRYFGGNKWKEDLWEDDELRRKGLEVFKYLSEMNVIVRDLFSRRECRIVNFESGNGK